MSNPNTQAISFRIKTEKIRRLERLAEATDRPRSWHLEQALDAYLENQAWQIAHIEEGVADADAGRTLPHERIREWLQTWGSDDEPDPPV